MEPKVLRTHAAAEFVGLSVSTLEKMRLSGGGPDFIRLGERAVGYEVEALNRWLEQRRQATAPARG